MKVWVVYPADIYSFKFNNRNTRTVCEIYLKLTISTSKRRHWTDCTHISGVSFVDFEQVNAG